MAKKNWIAGAVEHPGAATEAAQAEGLTVAEWARKHANDSGVTGKRARLAMVFEGMARAKKRDATRKAAKAAAMKQRRG